MTLERIPVPLPLLGLSENVSADQQELGTTARALNVRGVDPRLPGRVRLAQRSGLEPHGTGTVVEASGSPVVAMFQGVKDTPPDRWVEIEDGDVTTKWTTTTGAAPVAAKVGPDGNCYTLLSNGNVVIHGETGKLLGTVDAQAPTGFRVVPDIGVDEDGAVYVMAANDRRIDGGAGRIYRMRKDEDYWTRESEAVFEWIPRAFVYDRGELLITASKPEGWNDDPEEDGPAPAERLYRVGGAKGQPFVVWHAPAAQPAVALSANERGDIYVASPRNPDRVAATAAPHTPAVGWMPREAIAATDGVNAWQGLYFHLSANRAQNVQGVADGAAPEYWRGATHDPSDWQEVIDVRRDVQAQPQRYPVFDTNGLIGAPGFVFNGYRCFVSLASNGWHEKDTTDDTAAHMRSVFPNMRDTGGAGAKFTVSILFRINAYLAADDPYYVFEQGDYSLSYDANGTPDTVFTFTYPGGSTTFSAALGGVGARHCVFTFVHGGHGAAGASSAYIHSGGVVITAAALTCNINQANERCVLGGYRELAARLWTTNVAGGSRYDVGDTVWNRGAAYTCLKAHYAVEDNEPGVGASWSTGGFWAVVAKNGLSGAISEVVVFLGGSTVATAPHDTANTATLYNKVEGFIANAYGRRQELDAVGPHPYRSGPPNGLGDDSRFQAEGGLQTIQPITVKYARAEGRVQWVFSSSGMGSGVVSAPDDFLFTATTEPNSVGTVRARRLKDLGDSASQVATGAYPITDGPADGWLGERIQLAVDACGDLYLPWVDAEAVTARSLRRYAAEGNGVGGPLLTWTYELGSEAYPVVALASLATVDERETGGACGPEFLYVPYVDPTPPLTPSYGVKRVDVLAREATGATAPRAITLLGVSKNGTVSRYNGTAWSSVAATALPGDYVWTATLFSKTFLGNGREYRVYDHKNATLRAFDESTVGRIPPRCRLGKAWRGRLVLARGDSAHDWFMSAVADPFDWDFAPDLVTETQAVSGASSQVGEVPDLVNALIPWSDDLLLFGCDSSIWRLTGDPMTSGELHRVSDITGVAYGEPWCKDPEQRVYFWGSRGGLYGLTPDGTVQPLSEGRIHRRLQDVDLSKYLVRLVWNDVDQGVHAFLLPYDGRGEPYHYFWERRTGAFWADQFHGTDLQVRGVFLADGDLAADRSLLLAGADGRIRRWSASAPDDDGTGIRASCLVGPVTPDTAGAESRVVAVEGVLARDQGGALASVGATREADVPYHVGAPVELSPGRNGYTRVRARGAHVWVELASASMEQPWAVEDLAVHIAPAGRKR